MLVEMQRRECIWHSYAIPLKVNIKFVQRRSISAFLLLNFMQIFYFRVEDYNSSGLETR